MWALIKWEDTTSIEEAWSSEEDAKILRPLVVLSVGRKLHETDAYITIAGSIGVDDGDYGDVTCIPKGCILKMTTLTDEWIEEDFDNG